MAHLTSILARNYSGGRKADSEEADHHNMNERDWQQNHESRMQGTGSAACADPQDALPVRPPLTVSSNLVRLALDEAAVCTSVLTSTQVNVMQECAMAEAQSTAPTDRQ